MSAPLFVGTASAFVAGTGSTLVVPYPANLQAGDLLGVFFVGQGRTTSIPDVTLPSGWTVLAPGIGPNNQCRIFVFIQDARATGTESGNFPTFTIATPGTGGVVGGVSFALRNVATVNFTEQGNSTTGTGTTVTHSAVTTAGTDRLVVSFVGVGGAISPGSFSGETGGDLVSQFSDSDIAGDDIGGSIQTAVVAGSGTTLTGGTITIASDDWATYTVAFIPVAAVDATLSPAAGALAIAGQAPSVTSGTDGEAFPPVGSLSITGFAPTWEAGGGTDVTALPTTGAIAATGLAPNVIGSNTIEIGAIQWVAQSFEVSSQDVLAIPGTGQIVAIGFAPDVPQGLAERLTPNAVLAGGSNLEDTLTNSPPTRLADIDEPTGSDDTEWWTAVNPAGDIDVRLAFPTSSGNLVGTQQLRVLIRGTSLPSRDVKLELWESGVKLSAEITEQVTSISGQIVTLTFDATDVADVTGAGVELRILAAA